MRDYKNVKVPKKYRTDFTRVGPVSVKRASAGRVVRTRVPKAGAVMLKVFMAVMVFGVCFLGWKTYQWTERTGVFQITGVDVKGVRQMTEDDVKAIAGVFTGQHIFKADIQGAARRARANSWVKEVNIYRRLPNRISMVIEERVPAVILETPGGRYLVDGDGVVIERLGKGAPAAWPLPVVTMKRAPAHPGEQVAGEEMSEALTLVSELSSRGGWRMADITIKAESAASLTVVYAGHEIRIGSGNYGEKLRRLGEVMADVKRRGVQFAYVDLRPERQAAVMVVKKNEKVRR
jgi:cell division protein FtsQ